jgi:hypothetical protein
MGDVPAAWQHAVWRESPVEIMLTQCNERSVLRQSQARWELGPAPVLKCLMIKTSSLNPKAKSALARSTLPAWLCGASSMSISLLMPLVGHCTRHACVIAAAVRLGIHSREPMRKRPWYAVNMLDFRCSAVCVCQRLGMSSTGCWVSATTRAAQGSSLEQQHCRVFTMSHSRFTLHTHLPNPKSRGAPSLIHTAFSTLFICTSPAEPAQAHDDLCAITVDDSTPFLCQCLMSTMSPTAQE